MSETEEKAREHETFEQMGDRLVMEATSGSPVQFDPSGPRMLIFPVVPDEERPVDIHVVKQSRELPDMGVICAVGWEVNEGALGAWMHYRDRAADPDESEEARDTASVMADAIQASGIYSVGDIVAFNRFSGMAVPGTTFVVLDRRDLLGRVRRLPVRLRRPQERWDQVQEQRRERDTEPRVATPSSIIGG